MSYRVETQGIKKVQYWAARTVDGDFTPNDEVDELKWLPVSAAIKQVQYPHDRKVLRRFAKLPADTKTISDRSARHRRKQVPLQGRRPVTPAGQARPRAGRIIGRTVVGVRRRHALCGRSRPMRADP